MLKSERQESVNNCNAGDRVKSYTPLINPSQSDRSDSGSSKDTTSGFVAFVSPIATALLDWLSGVSCNSMGNALEEVTPSGVGAQICDALSSHSEDTVGLCSRCIADCILLRSLCNLLAYVFRGTGHLSVGLGNGSNSIQNM